MDADIKECPPEKDSNIQALPKVGMIFQSEDHAYDFYNQYAKSVGFSVRKDSSTVRADGMVLRRVLCCSKQGLYKNRSLLTNLRARTRTGCEARIIIRRRGEKYVLIEFNEYHNHELVAPSEVHRLRSQRKIEDSQVRIMRNMYRAGVGSADVYSSMCKKFGGPQNLNFSKVDCVNFLQRVRRDDNAKMVAHDRDSMVVDCKPSLERDYDCGNSMIVDCQPSLEKGDDLGTSMVIDCHPSSTSQSNDLAHLALTIVAKGNTSENSVVFTRRLLNQVLEELDNFLKLDNDKSQQLVDIRNMHYDKVGEGKKCVDEVGAGMKFRDLQQKKANGWSGKTKGTLEKGKGKRKLKKLPTGSCDQVSIGAIGTTLLMLQDSSMLPKPNNNQAYEEPSRPQEDSER